MSGGSASLMSFCIVAAGQGGGSNQNKPDIIKETVCIKVPR
jgi:hypothetical protein